MMNYSYGSYKHDDDEDSEENQLGEGFHYMSDDDGDSDPLEDIDDLTLPPEDLELLEDEDDDKKVED